MEHPENGLLSPYRVLDLTDDKGFLCARILADLRADVIKIEPPGGDPARRIGPFYADVADPEKSLYWWAYNLNKRGITLNIETADGQNIFKRLVQSASFVIESFSPGYMDSLGLGYSALEQINPGIIMTSISPFGQTGPRRDFKASDLVAWSMGGIMITLGDIERPCQVSLPQAYLQAGAQAAAGTLIAHYYRQQTGQGQQVDVSIVEAASWELHDFLPDWDLNRRITQRWGVYRGGRAGRAKPRALWDCKDGRVAFSLLGGESGAKSNKRLVELMVDKGMCPDFLREVDWSNLKFDTITQEEIERLEAPIARFFLSCTKAELEEVTSDGSIWLYKESTVSDILEDPQLKSRNFWVDLEHPELGTSVRYPGAFAKLSETSCVIKHRPPLIGEHNEQIYLNELGFSKEELLTLKQLGVI